MVELLPILIRQASLSKPLTYGDVARELGVHHRAVHHIAGYIGFTLRAVGARRGWTRRRPPPIHALIVNEITQLPGQGIDGFLSQPYQDAGSNQEKRALLEAVYYGARHYAHWPELCSLLNVPLDEDALAGAVEKARRAKGRGGEGPHHLALKTYVSQNPHVIGLAFGSRAGGSNKGPPQGTVSTLYSNGVACASQSRSSRSTPATATCCAESFSASSIAPS